MVGAAIAEAAPSDVVAASPSPSFARADLRLRFGKPSALAGTVFGIEVLLGVG
jgi:hypothetical protein